MPYSLSNPPAVTKLLPQGAKKIFIAVVNAALAQKKPEASAFRIAWAAVKNKYTQSEGKWVLRTDGAPLDDCEVELEETLTLDTKGFTLTGDGFLVATPRVARTGIQIYKGYEVGRPDMEDVRVYRPEDEVFSRAAMASLAHRTITLDHPYTKVDASNWKEHSVGHSSEPVARDGDFVRVPLVLMDAHAIVAAQSGKSQLSVGYGAKLKWEAGQTPDGQLYDAMQQEIRANHIALVTTARGGNSLMIGDDDFEGESDGDYGDSAYFDREFSTEQRKQAAAKGQALPGGGFPIKSEQDLKNAIRAIGRAKNRAAAMAHIKKRARALGLTSLIPEGWGDAAPRKEQVAMTVRNIDGVQMELEDKDGQILDRFLAGLDTKIKDAEKKLADAQAEVGKLQGEAVVAKKALDTKDGEVAALKKQLGDVEMTPAKLDQLVRDRMDVVDRAIRAIGDKVKPDGKTDIQLKRDVVAELMGGEAAKNMSDEAINGAFYALTKPVTTQDGYKRMASAWSGQPAGDGRTGAEAAYVKRNEQLRDAWKPKASA